MWHYVKDGVAAGPVSEEEMRELIVRGAVVGSTLVWKKGMTEWAAASAAGLLDVPAEPAAARPEPPPPPPPAPYSPAPAPTPAAALADQRTMAVLAHLLGIFTGFLGPLIILLATQDEPVKSHARRALNWQISLMIYMFVSFFLAFILIGFLLIFALFILDLIFCILAAVKAGDRIVWNYPMSITFLKD